MTSTSTPPTLRLGKARLDMPNMLFFTLILLVFFGSWVWNSELYPDSFKSSASVQGARYLILVAGLYLGTLSFHRAAKLGEAARVLATARTPDALWQGWLRAFLRAQWLAWAIITTCATLMFVETDGSAKPGGVLLIYSLIATGSTAAPLAQRGLLHKAWGRAIPLAFVLLLGVAGPNSYRLLTHLPLLLQLALSAAWPALAWHMYRHWRLHAPSAPNTFQAERQGSWNKVCAWYRRFKPVTTDPKSKYHQQFGFFQILPYLAIMQAYDLGPNQAWGGNIGLMHLFALTFFAAFVCNCLYCRDLHWRMLLAPNRLAKGKMGWHIAGSTLAIFASAVIALAVIYMVLAWLIIGISPISTMKELSRFSSIVCEMVFLICLATALRGARHWWLAVIGFYGVCAIAVLGMAFTFKINAHMLMTPWFHVGPGYIAGLIAGSLVCILVANRLWTTQRLLPFVVQGMEEEEMPDKDWLRRVGLTRRRISTRR